MYVEQRRTIDLTKEAIASNRDALLGIVAWLFNLLGLDGGSSLPRMPRALYRAVLQVLVPAEAALRRLIVLAAQGLSVTLKPAAASRFIPPPQRGSGTAKGRASPPPFQLLDPKPRAKLPRRLRRVARVVPRLSVFDWDGRFFVSSSELPKPKKPTPDGLVDPTRLCRRLAALKRALATIPHQAKRLARWRARQEQKQAATPPATPTRKPLSPLREGLPPGYRKRRQHEVDDILAECHDLALLALAPDTS